jgi:DNA-binding beta-propeller fold protein YncE
MVHGKSDESPPHLEAGGFFYPSSSYTYSFTKEARGMRSNKFYLYLLIVSVVTLIITGCGGSNPVDPGVVPEGTRIIVANSLGETLSQFTYIGGTYSAQNDIAATGQAPNQIIVKGDVCYVLNSLANSVLALDLTTYAVIFEASVGQGKSPYNMAFINNDEVLVTDFIGDDCVRLFVHPEYTGSDRIRATIPLPTNLPKDSGIQKTNPKPQGVFIYGSKAYVAMANLDTSTWTTGGPGMVAIIDLTSNEVQATFQTTGRDTMSFCQDPFQSNKLYIISAGDSTLDMDTFTVEWSLNGKIDVFNLSTQGIVDSVDADFAPFEMVIASNGYGYVADGSAGKVYLLNTSSNSISSSIQIAPSTELSYISGIAIGPAGFVYALQFNNDEVAIIDTDSENQIVQRMNTGDGPDAITVIW